MPNSTTGVIDAHVHIYPAGVARDPKGWSRASGEPLWGALVAPNPGRRVRQGWADCERLLRDMDVAGVERSILLGWYWERQETCEWHNRYYASCIQQHPDRLSAFATVQANAGDRALQEIDRAIEQGFIGLGELCPRAFGTSLLDSSWISVFERAVERGLPVNLHVTDPAGRPYAGRVLTPLDEFVALAARLPDLCLILAHWGGGLAFHELNPHCRRTMAGVFYDTAATSLLYRREIFRQGASIVGSGRILFGSDYPLLVYPSDQTEPELSRVVDDVRSSDLTPTEVKDILGGNAARLFR